MKYQQYYIGFILIVILSCLLTLSLGRLPFIGKLNQLGITPALSYQAENKNKIFDKNFSVSTAKDSEVRIVVISDLNGVYGSTEYDSEVKQGIDLIYSWQPDLVLCGGDMIAGQDPRLSKEQIEAMWQAFDQNVAKPLREGNFPFGFTIGNHDASSAVGPSGQFLFSQERDLAAKYWNDSTHDPGLQFIDRYKFPFYYTFALNDIFFLVWDGSSQIIPEQELAWVEKSLASDRSLQAKMRVMIGHLPLYGIAVDRDQAGEVMANAEQLRRMMEKYNVHTYISGHHHAYYPGHRGNLQLLHAGILGSGPRPLIEGRFPPAKTITIVDINFDDPKLTTYTTYNLETMELIEYQQLPRFLPGHNGLVLRRDIEREELTQEEENYCQQKLNADLCSASHLN